MERLDVARTITCTHCGKDFALSDATLHRLYLEYQRSLKRIKRDQIEIKIREKYTVLEKLREDVWRTVGCDVIFEPDSGLDINKDEYRRHHHFKITEGHPRVFAWAKVMPLGPRGGKGPCASISVLGKSLDRDDPMMSYLEWRPDAGFVSQKKGGAGEMKGIIYTYNDKVYRQALYALVKACKACLGQSTI